MNVAFRLSPVPRYSPIQTPILQPKVSVGKQRVLALALETRQKHSVGLPSISVTRSLHTAPLGSKLDPSDKVVFLCIIYHKYGVQMYGITEYTPRWSSDRPE